MILFKFNYFRPTTFGKLFTPSLPASSTIVIRVPTAVKIFHQDHGVCSLPVISKKTNWRPFHGKRGISSGLQIMWIPRTALKVMVWWSRRSASHIIFIFGTCGLRPRYIIGTIVIDHTSVSTPQPLTTPFKFLKNAKKSLHPFLHPSIHPYNQKFLLVGNAGCLCIPDCMHAFFNCLKMNSKVFLCQITPQLLDILKNFKKQAVFSEINAITPLQLKNVFRNLLKQAKWCRDAKGGHFQHFYYALIRSLSLDALFWYVFFSYQWRYLLVWCTRNIAQGGSDTRVVGMNTRWKRTEYVCEITKKKP